MSKEGGADDRASPAVSSVFSIADNHNGTDYDTSPSKLVIFHHDDCTLHNINKHPECPARVIETLKVLRSKYSPDTFKEAPLGTEEQICMFHTKGLYNRNMKIFEDAEATKSKISIDGDTSAMAHTKNAAFRGVGAVTASVDLVYGKNKGKAGRASNPHLSTFCLVRPPGHHADPDESGGFCFFNNAGIAARYAQEKYGVRKVAVLDFDIHHGNGTENGFKTSETLFYGSTHQKNGYPGTGEDPSPFVGDKANDPLHRRIVNRFTNVGKKNSSPNFRVKWAEILSEMIRFGPNFVIISAGFDAHKFDPLSDANLVEADFEWATTEIYKACNRIDPTNSIPIISVLEGGYNVGVLGDCVLAHVKVLEKGYNCLPQTLPSATIVSTNVAATESTTEDASSSSAVDEITAGMAEVAVDTSADP